MAKNICEKCKYLQYDVFYSAGEDLEYVVPYCTKTGEEFPEYEECEHFEAIEGAQKQIGDKE